LYVFLSIICQRGNVNLTVNFEKILASELGEIKIKQNKIAAKL
jgi:hypothetical protein